MAAARGQGDDSSEIVVLESLAAVRARPGMYIGGTDERGLHHLVSEVVANSLDAHLGGTATRIAITVSADQWVEVRDDGPGIPVKKGPGRRSLETFLTTLHAGATADGHLPHVHLKASSAGVGLAVVNALSRRLELHTSSDGRRWTIACERGVVVEPLRDVGPTKERGTTVRFQPDRDIFAGRRIPVRRLRAHLQELAWLTPTLRWSFQRRRVRSTNGLLDALEPHGPLLEGSIIHLADRREDMGLEFVLALRRAPLARPRFEHSLNSQRLETGSHEKAIVDAVKKVFPSLINRLDCASHLTLLAPRFEGPTRSGVHLPKATPHVHDMITTALTDQSDHRITWLQAR